MPPDILIHSYNTLIKPILLYGSDVWGSSKNGWATIDKACLWFIRCILSVKSTTSKLMSFGEVGVVAPSILCQINVLTYYVRVMNMENDRIAKIVFNELVRLNDVGFNTWVSSARDISHKYGIDIDCCENTSAYLKNIKATVTDYYQKHWFQSVNNVTENPLLRTYRLFKHIFRIEPYLIHVKNDKHRKALSKFRCSSHFLEIERARHKIRYPCK